MAQGSWDKGGTRDNWAKLPMHPTDNLPGQGEIMIKLTVVSCPNAYDVITHLNGNPKTDFLCQRILMNELAALDDLTSKIPKGTSSGGGGSSDKPSSSSSVETFTGRRNDSRSDLLNAIRDIAEDNDLDDDVDDLQRAILSGLPFSSPDAMLRAVLLVIPRRAAAAQRIVDYIDDGST